ncbi:MAG: threonine synthase [Firmicutes bacterium]|nr:threonine synthase [Bacillota bacterium]
MLYESTRGSLNKLTGAQAVIRGIAEDKGLYVPENLPKLPFKPEEMVGRSYREIALEVLLTFFDDFKREDMEHCVNSAYDEKFTASDICEINQAGGAHFLELYHGKTAAFKDMALSILPYLLITSLKMEGITDRVLILTATSGDTGKAALEGFAGVPGTGIMVFYPDGGVSQLQRAQMVTQAGDNVKVYAVKGNFDDCQTNVKKIFNDEAIRAQLKEKNVIFSSANSINVGRLVPQVAYYVYSYVKLIERGVIKAGDPINVAVPTGNFGNILAAYFADQMGIPINRFICASNENKVLTDFLKTGLYDIRPEVRGFKLTNSPSMDILVSSNLERLLYLMNGRDQELVNDWMTSLETLKFYTVMDSEPLMEGLKRFYAGYATEEETLTKIGETWKNEHYLMDTHTAVCKKVYDDYVSETGDTTPTVICSTASAYKFPQAVGEAIGCEPASDGFDALRKLNEVTGVEVPYGLRDLDKREVRHSEVISIEEMEEKVGLI